MPTYALLGATGATGSSILRHLLSHPPPNLTLNILVRSKAKLLSLFPILESNTTIPISITIIEGPPSDTLALQTCLSTATVIFVCIATNVSTPNLSLAQDTSASIISALKHHHTTNPQSYTPPTILQLRSASLNPTLSAQIPWLAKQIPHFLFYYIYEDLRHACQLYELAVADNPGLFSYVYVDPPSIHDADGTTPTGHKLILGDEGEEQKPALNYADLGVAFCEIAERRGEFAGRAVGVSATGHVRLTWGVLMGYMAKGVKARVWG